MARSPGRSRRLTPANRRTMAANGVVSNPTHRTYPGRIKRPAPGMCRWCGVLIWKPDGMIDRNRTFCGQQCVTNYLLRADPSVMRRHVFFRDQGFCGICGKQHLSLRSKDWQADHMIPLFMAAGDPEFWEPENVQVLCTSPCHHAKSSADRERYAGVRALLKETEPVLKRVRLADRLN